jgi:hypothetical protein
VLRCLCRSVKNISDLKYGLTIKENRNLPENEDSFSLMWCRVFRLKFTDLSKDVTPKRPWISIKTRHDVTKQYASRSHMTENQISDSTWFYAHSPPSEWYSTQWAAPHHKAPGNRLDCEDSCRLISWQHNGYLWYMTSQKPKSYGNPTRPRHHLCVSVCRPKTPRWLKGWKMLN